MTSSVTVGKARTSFLSATGLPRIDVEGALRVLVVGPANPKVMAALRRIRPEPAIGIPPPGGLTEDLFADYDAVFLACNRDDSATWTQVRLVVRLGRFVPVIAVIDAAAEAKETVKEEMRAAGVNHTVLERDVTPALLEAVAGHAKERALLESELVTLRDRFALAARGAFEGMWEWEVTPGKFYYSQRWCELLGLDRADVGEAIEDWLGRVHANDVSGLSADLNGHVNGRLPVFQNEHRIRTADGEYRWVLARGIAERDENGQATRVSGSLIDVTAYRQRETDVREQSRHDAVTDLPRQQVFLERLARAVEVRRSYSDYGFAVLMVQVDRFALIRDSFGQDGADEVLSLASERVQSCVTQDEVICRYGEDRFAVLIENIEDPSEGTTVADKVHRTFETPLEVREQKLYVTVSIGMTSSARDYGTVDELITDVSAAADHARESRKQGAARHQIYNTSMRIEALTLLQLEIAMREAIEREEFQLHYQPVVAVATGKLVGFEALMRWLSPTRGRVSPGEFIPVAENTGLIVPIGRWAVQEAARQLKAWEDEFGLNGALAININVSGRQVQDAELQAVVADAIQQAGIPPRCIKLELTESVLMENAEFAIEFIQRLRTTGCQLYVDDFGTGYSSLSYLHRFPVDGLKIDKSFVDELDGTEQSGVMIKTILEMAGNLGLDVVAEGIETEEQVAQLSGLRCPHGQGYHWAAPLPTDGARERIIASLKP
jgi:diguanylate cyclase (GGDEF)-like protein/PAS domain S-box-containing protein